VILRGLRFCRVLVVPLRDTARAMSQNVDTLRSIQEIFNRRDYDDALQFMHPSVAIYPAVVGVDVESSYHGRAEVKQFWETISETWDTYVIEDEEIIEAPGNRVLVVERWRGRGRQGIEVDVKLTDVYTFRDGLIVRIDGFSDKADALKAVGLKE
jgi:ketosteroid isomerase-like protein